MRMVVAYDGAPFRGFALNDGVRTVLGELTTAVSTVVREPCTPASVRPAHKVRMGWAANLPSARSLAEEVMAEAKGPLKVKAQAFLNALS